MNERIITASAENIGIGEAGITALFGYIVVFCGLALLMLIIYIVGSVFKAKDKKAKEAKSASTAETPEVSAEITEKNDAPLAPGSAGRVKLFDVPDKEAAMIMAIVADKMQKPLNELHFISIKEVK